MPTDATAQREHARDLFVIVEGENAKLLAGIRHELDRHVSMAEGVTVMPACAVCFEDTPCATRRNLETLLVANLDGAE